MRDIERLHIQGRGWGGNFHVGDSGMMYVGIRRPTSGYNYLFNVMDEDVVFRCPGIESWIKGGAGLNEWVRAR